MCLAKNIRFLRKQKGITQDALADILGYKSYTTIQKWESGVSEPPIKQLRRMAEIFNVDIDDMAKVDIENKSINHPPYQDAEDFMEELALDGQYERDEFFATMQKAYAALNQDGRQQLLSYTDIICQMPQYQKDTSSRNGKAM